MSYKYKDYKLYKGVVGKVAENEELYEVPNGEDVRVYVAVPYWFFNDEAICYFWSWKEGEEGKWSKKCYTRTDAYPDVSADVSSDHLFVKIVRLPKEFENNPNFDNAWNTSGDIDLTKHTLNPTGFRVENIF